MKDPDQIYHRYQSLQDYVHWSEQDAGRVRALAPLFEPHLVALVDDFYQEIARHPEVLKVFTGGQEQVDRLKVALLGWLRDLLNGPYDRSYVLRRWKVGSRHVEIGLDQVYTNAALSRLRDGLMRLLGDSWTGDAVELVATIRSLNKLIDLDLAKIEDAYQAEYMARLQGSERLAALGQIAGGVAHELRNPLNVVQTSLYYLSSARSATPEKRAEHMRRIERNVIRANDVITTLTNFARCPEPEVEAFEIEPCVREAVEDSGVPDKVDVVFDFPSGLAPVLADRSQVRIVLGNLIRNAVDAMLMGGRLVLAACQLEDGLDLSVTDNGVGIKSADLGRVMEPLYSTKARGMGLGLALSQMIVERNHGRLRVESEPGNGSTFTIRLAVASTESEGSE